MLPRTGNTSYCEKYVQWCEWQHELARWRYCLCDVLLWLRKTIKYLETQKKWWDENSEENHAPKKMLKLGGYVN